jgi:hypothetical protein
LGRPIKGAGNREHLLLAAGQGPAALMLTPLKQGKEFEHMFQVIDEVGWIRGDDGAHLEIFQHCHARENPTALRRLRDPKQCDLVGGKVGDVLPVEQDSSFEARGRPKIDIIRVLLPAPLAPISATISPSRMSRLTLCSTGILP